MRSILNKLRGGDRRSIGRSNEVVAEVLKRPELFEALFAGLDSTDSLVRMRAADAIEKITVKHPEFLQPHKQAVITLATKTQEKEVRWHAAQLLPRLDLDRAELSAVVKILNDYLDDSSSIVKTFAMQALSKLADRNPSLRRSIVPRLRELTESGTPAMKARGRKLLAQWSVGAKHF